MEYIVGILVVVNILMFFGVLAAKGKYDARMKKWNDIPKFDWKEHRRKWKR